MVTVWEMDTGAMRKRTQTRKLEDLKKKKHSLFETNYELERWSERSLLMLTVLEFL